jgi:heme/copper-type cytochrome/quinol oxidase subunit 1
MPPLTRWYIKCALLYLIAALLIGVGAALPGGWQPALFFTRLRPVYFHLFLVGWVTLFILGVANWLFPRASRQHFNHHPTLAWITFGLLNTGLLLRIFLEPVPPGTAAWIGWGLALSAVLQWSGGLLAILQLGRRVWQA